MPFLIRDLFLAGAVGGLNCLLYAQKQQSTAAAAENWFYFVEKARAGIAGCGIKKNSHCAKNRESIDICQAQFQSAVQFKLNYSWLYFPK